MGIKGQEKARLVEEVMKQDNKELIGDITENAFSAVVWAKSLERLVQLFQSQMRHVMRVCINNS